MGLYMYGYGWVERRLFMHVEGSLLNKFAALLAAICARIGSRKAKSKAGEIPPFFC